MNWLAMAWMSWSLRHSSKLFLLIFLLRCGLSTAQDFSDFQFKRIGTVKLQADGSIDELELLNLIELTPNVDILTRSKIQRSIELLYKTGNFTNILVDAEMNKGRVDLTFILHLVYRIQDIDLQGSTGISKGKIRKAMRMRKLEPYTPERILKGREDILAVLFQNGFYNARVRQDVILHRQSKRAEVNYIVAAGTQARVASVNISGDTYFSRQQILQKMKSLPGKKFTEPKYAKDLDRIGNFYDRNGFLEHTLDSKKEVLPPPAVKISIVLNSGKQLILETAGYKFPEDVLRDRVPIWVERSYNDDTLEEGKRNLIDYLQTKGYYDAKISWNKDTSGQKIQVHYAVDPGTKYSISEIVLEGNQHLPTHEIRNAMATKESGLFTPARLVTKTFESDQENILNAYRQIGFLFARFTKKQVDRLSEGKLRIVLGIDEGPQSIVKEIQIRGNQVISTEELLKRFQLKVNEPVSEGAVKADTDLIVALYSDRGYPKIQVENRLRLSQDKTRASVEYRITEGEQIFVNRIVITGNNRTARDIIEESLYFDEDEPLSLRKISESQSRLYSLNIFDRVDIDIPRPDSLQKFQDVLIRLTEAKPYTISYGIGYQSFDLLRGTFAISNRNLFGTARTLSLNLRAGFREGRALLSYTDPHLFFHHLSNNISGFAEYGERTSFSFHSVGASIQFEKKLSRDRAYLEVGEAPEPLKSVFFRYAFEDIRTFFPEFNINLAAIPPEDRPFLAIHISSVSTGYVRDNRDNAIDPIQGNYLSSSLQFSSNILGSGTDFVKTFNQFQYYIPWRRTVIATSYRLGLAWGFRNTQELPLSQRFFAGGGRTIRGFEQDMAGPLVYELDENGNLVNPEPVGGNMLTILNLEYRFPVYGAIGAVIFFDYGTVFPEVSTFAFSEMRKSAGLGIRYKTPIGPLTVDWGHKLDRRPGESASAFFISVGHAF
jgi:outer membrane protein insertion porin family